MKQDHRSRRKRTDRQASSSAIGDAALTLFLRKGFRETTTDEIAALAGVSKQTIYRLFPDKEALFNALIRGSIEHARSFLRDAALAFDVSSDPRTVLQEVALKYVETTFQPKVLQLRRLVIAEAQRFPDLARTYYTEVPERTLAALADSFRRLAKQGALRVANPGAAARQFASLLIVLPLDRAMFGDPPTRAELKREALEGVDAFLAAYSAQTRRDR